MVDYAQYSEMKLSREKWLGEIPASWKVLRLKHIFSIKKDIAGEEGHTVLSVTQKGIRPKAMSEKGQFAQDYSKYQLVNHGDFVMNHMDLLTGWVDISQYEGVTSPDYRVFINNKPDQFDSGYYRYIFQLCYSARIFYGLGQGVAGFGRWRLPSDMFLNFVLPVPNISEQQAIAAYLDDQVAQIDSIIAEAQTSIEEYKQWKASIIKEAVTLGIQEAPLRDCGSDWIGNIPERWALTNIGKCYNVDLGKMLAPVKEDENDELVSYLSAVNIKWTGINTDVKKEMWMNEAERKHYLLEEGDLLIMEGGMAGTACIYRNEFYPCYIQNSVLRCRGKKGQVNRFLYYWLYFVYHKGYIDSICNKATIQHYTKEKVKATPFVFVPKDEQLAICSFLDEKTQIMDELIAEKQALISDLETYKRSLIYEVVTGKRKVV